MRNGADFGRARDAFLSRMAARRGDSAPFGRGSVSELCRDLMSDPSRGSVSDLSRDHRERLSYQARRPRVRRLGLEEEFAGMANDKN